MSDWRQAAADRLRGWSARRHGIDVLPLAIDRRRIYILPTGAGFALAAAVSAMLIAALNYGNNLGLAFAFWIVSIALTGMHHCHRNLLKLGVDARAAEDGFAGGETQLHFALRNDSGVDRYDVQVMCRGAAALQSVPAGAERRVTLALKTPQRGILRVEQFELRTRFPFGWFRAWSYVQAPLVVYVAPMPVGVLHLTALEGGYESTAPSEFRGDDEFSGLRAYSPGIPLKQMAWKVLARSDSPMVRSYTSAAGAPLWLDWFALKNLSAEERLSQLCLWVIESEAARRRYGLRLPGLEIGPSTGAGQRVACLRALSGFVDEARS